MKLIYNLKYLANEKKVAYTIHNKKELLVTLENLINEDKSFSVTVKEKADKKRFF
jgi:hypothetical protein